MGIKVRVMNGHKNKGGEWGVGSLNVIARKTFLDYTDRIKEIFKG